jgi:pimeloyl-ACP methyl ester carboxylesterase
MSPSLGDGSVTVGLPMSIPPLVADVIGAGPAVVLLHGQPGSAADWAAVAPLLTSRCTVVIPDRPGYGRTGGEAVGFMANATAVVALLDTIGIDSAIVVGYSWAGGVALALAEYWPDRISGLVLAASVGPAEPVSRLDRLLAVKPFGSAVAAFALGLAARALTLSFVRRRIRPAVEAATEDRLLSAASAWRQGKVWRSFATEQRALVRELGVLAGGLGDISVPTTIIVGTADHVVPPITSIHLAQAIGPARLVELSGAGHLLPHRHPTIIATSIGQLVRDSPQRP